jgi:hypothetical protein
MARWSLSVPKRSDHLVRVFLARAGMKKGDLSTFVGEAVYAEVLRRSASQLQQRDPDLGDAAAIELAESLAALETGLDDIREGRSQPAKEALREIASDLGVDLDR